MAVYTQNAETWCECDNCGFTMFAGFNATGAEVKYSFERDGWTVGGKVLCNSCSKDPRWIKRELEKQKKGA